MSKRLFGDIKLVWRKGSGHDRVVVGTLKKSQSGQIAFKYEREGVALASKSGFTSYPGIPLTYDLATDGIQEIFAQRLFKPERKDVNSFYSFWNIPEQGKSDMLHTLAFTQGLIPTDNFEFLADFNPISGLEFVSEVAGLSKFNVPKSNLKESIQLKAVKEPWNTNDPKAVALYNGEAKIGYVKRVHSNVFYKNPKFTPKVYSHHVEGREQVSKLFILIRF